MWSLWFIIGYIIGYILGSIIYFNWSSIRYFFYRLIKTKHKK